LFLYYICYCAILVTIACLSWCFIKPLLNKKLSKARVFPKKYMLKYKKISCSLTHKQPYKSHKSFYLSLLLVFIIVPSCRLVCVWGCLRKGVWMWVSESSAVDTCVPDNVAKCSVGFARHSDGSCSQKAQKKQRKYYNCGLQKKNKQNNYIFIKRQKY